MPKIVLTRVEDEYGNTPVAVLNIQKEGNTFQIEIRSRNRVIKDHLKEVLSVPFYQVSPMNYLANGIRANYALFVTPNTKLFILYIADRLGWYGYIARPVQLVTKSLITDMEFVDSINQQIIRKAMAGGGTGCSGGEMYYNKKGQLVVMRVPSGCMAVNNDGRIVGPGKYLHAIVNDQASAWHLMEIPQQYQKQVNRVEKLVEEAKDNPQKQKSIEKKVEMQRKIAKQRLEKGSLEYSPAYHLLTALRNYEKVNVTTEFEGREVSQTVETSYVTVPEEEKDLFVQNLDRALKNAYKIATTQPTESADGKEHEHPEDARWANITLHDVILINRKEGIIADGSAAADALRITKQGWEIIMAPPGTDLKNNKDKLQKELRKITAAFKNNTLGDVHPWLAAKHFLNTVGNKYGTNVIRIGDRTKLETLFNRYNSNLNDAIDPTSEAYKLTHQKLIAQATSVTLDESDFEALEPPVSEFADATKRRALAIDPNEQQKVAIVKNLRRSIRAKFMEPNKNGGWKFKKTVHGIRDFYDFVKKTGHVYWNVKQFPLNNPDRGGPYAYAMTKLMASRNMYAWTGGPRQNVGFDLNAEQGTGKTVIALAAEAVLRGTAPEIFKAKASDGKEVEKMTVIVAPNVHTWIGHLATARNMSVKAGDVFLVDGTREDRQAAFEELLRQFAATGHLPKYLVIGSGKFRKQKGTAEVNPENEEDTEESVFVEDAIDLKYLKALAAGFKSKNGSFEFDKGLIGALVIDEAGMFVNPDSQRTKIMRELRNLVVSTRNKGIVWTLNGETLSNSLTDVAYRLAYVNESLFDGEDGFLETYGKRIKGKYYITGVEAYQKARNYVNQGFYSEKDTMKAAMQTVQNVLHKISDTYNNSVRLTAEAIVGESRKFRNVINTGLRGTFARIYDSAFQKLKAIKAVSKMKDLSEAENDIVKAYSLGMFTITMGTSMGAINPRSMFEYGISTNILMRELKKRMLSSVDNPETKRLAQEKFERFQNELNTYLALATKTSNFRLESLNSAIPVVPITKDETVEYKGMKVTGDSIGRQKLWNEIISPEFRSMMEDITTSWSDPASEKALSLTQELLFEKPYNADNGEPRLVIAAPTRIGMTKLYNKLKEAYAGKDVAIQFIHGDVPQEDRARMEEVHADKSKKVITIVTNAGARGLNLESPYMIRYPFWSNAQAVQSESRAHRNPSKELQIYKIVTGGAAELMSRLENLKLLQAELFNSDTLSEEMIENFLEFAADKMDEGTLISTLEKINQSTVFLK